MQRLSRPLADLGSHYDVVVVGSGYGGAIAACRLARAGRTVALLERGREIHPGHFPADLAEATRQTQVSAPALGPAEQVGDRRGLYWFRADGDLNVLTGCGLGGTSLINAGVSLRPDPRVFDFGWPTRLRCGAGGRLDPDLAAGFEAAEAMLRPSPYPDSWPPLPKVEALRVAAGDHPVEPVPVNVTFRTGPSPAGVHQHACTGCGDCVSGCNVGAKNTVLMNYLPDAVDHGAAVFTEVEVRTVSRTGDGGPWAVDLRPLARTVSAATAPRRVTADLVVLAAGTLGTTEILLRSASTLPLSPRLGTRFTGNGDAIGFAHRPGPPVRAVGAGDGEYDPAAPVGPCITAAIDRRDPAAPVDHGVIVEDAVIPGLLAGLVEAVLDLGSAARHPAGLAGWLERCRWRPGRRDDDHPAAQHLQTLLLMGHDDDRGRLVLAGDDARVEWPGVGTGPYYTEASRQLAELAGHGGGTYLPDPLWSRALHHSLITVHPLGGCVLADDPDHGVADHRGRVFDPGTPGGVHDGLVVADGSVVPQPLGVNPLLTIAALAERSMALLCRERGWTYDTNPGTAAPADPDPPDPPRPDPERPGLRFTEQMAGWWAPDTGPDDDALAPFEQAAARGEQDPLGALSFTLDLSTDDVAALTGRLDLPLEATGTVIAPRLSPDPLAVTGGTLRLLVADDPADPGARRMRYRLDLRTRDGRTFTLDGFKAIAPGDVGEVWGATSTLYVTVRSDDPGGPVLGRGVVRITPEGFARLLATAHVTGPVSHRRRLALEARFGRAFAGALAAEYGSVVHRTTSFNPDAPPRRRRPLDLPPGRRYPCPTPDGLELRLTRYRGGGSAPVLLSHGAGANPLTFSLDTDQPTLVEVLVAHGYDVWLQEWRASTLLPSSLGQWTGDQVASLDHPAATAVIAEATGRSDLHVVAHCVGAMTWLMATLGGWAAPTSLLCSSAGAFPVAPTLTRLKVGLHLSELLHAIGVRIITTDSTVGESFAERLFDEELRLYPVPRAEECDRAVCRRLAFLYGPAVRHVNLDTATHDALHELFGPTDLTLMSHLSRMARAERLVTADGADDYLVHLDRLARPVTFLHGAENLVWLPASSWRTYALLCRELDPADYVHRLLPGYGHQDLMIGNRAAGDVFPLVLDHLRRAGA